MIQRGTDLSQEQVKKKILKFYSQLEAEFIMSMLKKKDIEAIHRTEGMDEIDYLPLAETKEIMENRPDYARELDKETHATDFHHFMQRNRAWLKVRAKVEMERWKDTIRKREVLRYQSTRDICKEFKIYYGRRFPDKIERKQEF